MSDSQQPSVEKMSEARPKAGDADENQIDGDDEVEQAWHDQNENAGQQGDERRKVRERDVHGIPPVVSEEGHAIRGRSASAEDFPAAAADPFKPDFSGA